MTPVPAGAMLSPGQAVEFLNASRPHLARLLRNRDILFVPAGSHRRAMHADLMAYKGRPRARHGFAFLRPARASDTWCTSHLVI
ncbi:MAG: hypothetical protein OXF78_04105 [Rhodospirillales bacterium]|nr:hypothetical protein [Rhodospirillales bacterium]